MKFVEHSDLLRSGSAARKIIELANAFEPAQDLRIYIKEINGPSCSS